MAHITVTDAEFDAKVLKSPTPVLVDFWAEWCGPCQMIAPALEELGDQMVGKVTVAKVNVDENPQSPQKYGVRGIPAMMIFKDGKLTATKVGVIPKSALFAWVEQNL